MTIIIINEPCRKISFMHTIRYADINFNDANVRNKYVQNVNMKGIRQGTMTKTKCQPSVKC